MSSVNYFRTTVVFLTLIFTVVYYNEDTFSFKSLRAAIPSPETDFKLTMIKPSSGANIEAGTEIDVEWPIDYNAAAYRLELWSSSGFVYLITSGSKTSLKWFVPAVLVPGQHTLRVYKVTTKGEILAHAFSGYNVVGIRANDPNGKISVPSSSSVWVLQTANTLSFGNTSPFATWSAVIYSLTPGTTTQWGHMIVKKKSATSLTHTFTLPLEWLPGKYFIQFFFYNANDEYISTIGSQQFQVKTYGDRVKATPELIQVSSPLAAARFKKGLSSRITWSTDRNFDAFNIELFNINEDKYADSYVQLVVSQLTREQREFYWIPPENLLPSSRYFLRIWGYLLEDGTYALTTQTGLAYSDYFTIAAADGREDSHLEAPCTTDCKVKTDSSTGEIPIRISKKPVTGNANRVQLPWQLF